MPASFGRRMSPAALCAPYAPLMPRRAVGGRQIALADNAPMPVHSVVPLPATVRPPFEVYLNGVHQELGADYVVRDGALIFERELKKEGKLPFWRWFMGAWGVGSYGQNDSVDVRYEVDGRAALIEGLEIAPPA